MTAPLIALNGLTKRYGSFTAVDDVTLEVPEGSICGLLGPNGAGKTTTFKCMLGVREAECRNDCDRRRAGDAGDV